MAKPTFVELRGKKPAGAPPGFKVRRMKRLKKCPGGYEGRRRSWWHGGLLDDDVHAVLAEKPQIVIVATGMYGRKPRRISTTASCGLSPEPGEFTRSDHRFLPA